MNAIISVTLKEEPDAEMIDLVQELAKPFTCSHNKNIIILEEEAKSRTLYIWLELPTPRPEEWMSPFTHTLFFDYECVESVGMRFDSATNYQGRDPDEVITKKEVIDLVYQFCQSIEKRDWPLMENSITDTLEVVQGSPEAEQTTEVTNLRFFAEQLKNKPDIIDFRIRAAAMEGNNSEVKFTCNIAFTMLPEGSSAVDVSRGTYRFWMKKENGILQTWKLGIHQLSNPFIPDNANEP